MPESIRVVQENPAILNMKVKYRARKRPRSRISLYISPDKDMRARGRRRAGFLTFILRTAAGNQRPILLSQCLVFSNNHLKKL